MTKNNYLAFRINEDQKRIIEAKALAAGFRSKSEYIRYLLFMSMTTAEKIDKLYKKVCENAE